VFGSGVYWWMIFPVLELVLHQQQDIARQKSEILEQAAKVVEQAEINHQLKKTLNEQDRQINQILSQLEKVQLQVSDSDVVRLSGNRVPIPKAAGSKIPYDKLTNSEYKKYIY